MNVLSQFAQANRVIKQARLKPQELEVLVQKAQSRDQEAIDTLCKEYTGMLKNIAKKSFVRTILGYEDALQSGYMYFLIVVHSYKDQRFDILPGLFYLATLRGLYKEIKAELAYKNSVLYFEEENDNAEDLNYEDILEDPRAILDMDRVELEQLISRLEEKEQAVIKGIYLEDKDAVILAKELGYSESKVKYYKKKGIERLNYLLLKGRRRYFKRKQD